MTAHENGSPSASEQAQAGDAEPHVEHDTPMTGIYLRVLLVEVVVVVALWYFGRMFS